MAIFQRLWQSLTTSLGWRGSKVYASSGPRQYDGTFYEFRTYFIKPENMQEFLENTKNHIDRRTAHSELVGYWSQEIGGVMNKVFHIWKYDSFAHRTKVRNALAQDKEWQEKYISKNLPLIVKQKNEVTYLVPWCKIVKPPKEGVYELATFQMKPGGPALWGQAFEKAVKAYVGVGYTKLIGVFHTEYGERNKVHVLWWTETADSRAHGRRKAHDDVTVMEAVQESYDHLEFHENTLLIPTTFSPLK